MTRNGEHTNYGDFPGGWFMTLLYHVISILLGIVIPTGELIFFRGRAQPPSRLDIHIHIMYIYI